MEKPIFYSYGTPPTILTKDQVEELPAGINGIIFLFRTDKISKVPLYIACGDVRAELLKYLSTNESLSFFTYMESKEPEKLLEKLKKDDVVRVSH